MASMFGGLDSEAYDRQYSDLDLLRRLTHYMRPFMRKLYVIFFALLAFSTLGAAFPVLISRGVDLLATTGSGRILFWLVTALFVMGVANWGLNYLRSRLYAEVTGDIILSLRSDAFEASVEHELSFYDEFQTGRVISRITSDTQEFGNALRLVGDVLNQFATMLILLAVLFTIDVWLSLGVLILSPLVFLLALAWRRISRRVTRQSTRAMANVNTSIQEAVTGISVAKNFRQEASIYAEFDTVNRETYQINVRRGFVLSTIFPVLNGLMGFGYALLIHFGARAVAPASGVALISAGAWYLFITSVDRFWFPLLQLSAFWSQFQGGLSAAERIFALIDAKPAVIQIAENEPPKFQGNIKFERVCFRYSDQERVLTNFTLDIKPGESIALVGHTGAGKSSIAKLIARLYEFQEGSLSIDGQDIRSFDLHAYRHQLGIISQVPFLFSGTVAENIRYACPDATLDDILNVAMEIGQGEWLETLPNGLDSDVGERGARLSMGQRQLVALTRVLVQRPAMFILDEATASVDPFTESQIQEALDMILQNSTSIIIAHRLSTVRNADRIIVLRSGETIEEGNHEQLMAQGGHYAELYDTYFRHQSLEYIEDVGGYQLPVDTEELATTS